MRALTFNTKSAVDHGFGMIIVVPVSTLDSDKVRIRVLGGRCPYMPHRALSARDSMIPSDERSHTAC